eukprot:2448639-Rhodomonas_salina.1
MASGAAADDLSPAIDPPQPDYSMTEMSDAPVNLSTISEGAEDEQNPQNAEMAGILGVHFHDNSRPEAAAVEPLGTDLVGVTRKRSAAVVAAERLDSTKKDPASAILAYLELVGKHGTYALAQFAREVDIARPTLIRHLNHLTVMEQETIKGYGREAAQ